MCGIAGRVNFRSQAPVDPGVVGQMCDLLAHRGPDGHGTYCDTGVGLGHRRLAIIDLSPLGHQPMSTEDGQVTITYNGEIYNFLELRRELESRGHRFRSQSDTEVILAAYREFDLSCLDRLAGMFAFAIWDAPRRRLFLARDRLGKKPLFYRLDEDGIAFASEPKAFLAEPTFRPEVHLPAISLYLGLQYVPSPRSAFRGVEKLAPAHMLVVENGSIKVQRYWRLSYARKARLSEPEALEGLASHLRRAVAARLISDVPLGAFLSGGIDSGLVVSYMAECLDTPVRTFTIGFLEQEHNELPAARLVAEQYGTDHREFVVRPSAIDLLPHLVWHYNEPYADSSALPTFCLAELTRRYVTVALNGDAGDENFAGYDRYLASMLSTKLETMPRGLRRAAAALTTRFERVSPHPQVRRARRFAARLAEPMEQRYAAWVMHFDTERKARLCTPEFQAAATDDAVDLIEQAFAASDAEHRLERTLDVDVNTYLPDDLLVKVDIATMAHGLEGRSPFLDHRLMEFAASLPPNLKLRGTQKKYLLKRLAADRLPPALLKLPKKGFGVPIDHWFRGELRQFARDVLLDERARTRGYFEMAAVEQLLREHASGQANWHFQIWNLMMLELWHRMFIDVKPAAPAALRITEEDPARLAVSQV